MQKTKKHLASVLLTAALLAPFGAAMVALPASAAAQEEHRKWDDHEQAAWGRFLAEKHRKDHEYERSG